MEVGILKTSSGNKFQGHILPENRTVAESAVTESS